MECEKPPRGELRGALDRLEAVVDVIEEIRNIFRAPSLSIGVVHHGDTIFYRGFGFANLKTGLVPDANTIYSIGSGTKAFTGTSFGLLAQAGKIDLDAPVSSKMPELNTEKSPVVAEKMTPRDMLSHCAGLGTIPFLVIGRYGAVYAQKQDVVQIFNHLPRVAPFRTEWMYNNWLFALAGVLVARESDGLGYGQFVRRNILDKIGMARTGTSSRIIDHNHAVPYLVFDKRPPKAMDLPVLDDGIAFDASGCIRSCVSDMVLWTKALMKAWRMQQSGHLPLPLPSIPPPTRRLGDRRSGARRFWRSLVSPVTCCLPTSRSRSKRSSPSAQQHAIIDLLSAMAIAQQPHFPIAAAEDRMQQYCLGLFDLRMPTSEMNLVTNGDVNDRDYVIGKDSPPKVVVGHTGEYGGFLSAYWTFPETDSSIVVLCNSFQLNGDPTNIIAQLLAQALFDLRPQENFINIASKVVQHARARWDIVLENWLSNRIPGSEPAGLESYTGIYVSETLAMMIEISPIEGVQPNSNSPDNCPLRLRIKGDAQQVFDLYHYHHNSWTFLQPTRDECIDKGYFCYLYCWESFIIDFSGLRQGLFSELRWRLDTDERVSPQVFTRFH